MTTPTTLLTMKTKPHTNQPELLLISDASTPASRWSLDDKTREIGRKGLAEARANLRRPAHVDVAA